MRPLEDVRADVLGSVGRLGSERVGLSDAVGRVLAEPIVSTEDVPPFPNSAMDGFAVRSEDVATPNARLQVVADLPAGQAASVPVARGQAVRIMTGAVLPEGADTVVRVEETEVEGETVLVGVEVPAGTSVRPAGGDIEAGQTVFEPGIRLTPTHVGVLATVGVVEPLVSMRPRVALMSTGDELAPPETAKLGPGMIRDSNRPMLAGLLVEAGAEVLDLGRIPDEADTLRAAVGRAVAEADVVVTSGGVSMGDYDVTKLVLRDEVGVNFWQVAIKPAKPFAYGEVGGKPFFGLPGNPVSVLVSFEQFVRPALLTMQGARAVLRPTVAGVSGETLVTDPKKTVFVRVRVENEDGRLRAVSSGEQASNVLSATAAADAFAVVPRGVASVDVGEPIVLELFRSPETREYRRGV